MNRPDFSQLRATEVFDHRYQAICAKTDRQFCAVFMFQWFLSILIALILSPFAWSGSTSQLHAHVYAAVFLGAALTLGPIYLVAKYSGSLTSRLSIAVSQALFSTLLIHLTGGHVETHFHVFVSLAVLSFYRDWRVIALASSVVLLDHLLRGIFFPMSIYGTLSVSFLRTFEHAAWVVFEDIALFYAISLARNELWESCESQAKLEFALSSVEKTVDERTDELRVAQALSERRQQELVVSSKLSSLGEMAAGIAHEINNPIAVIQMKASQVRRLHAAEKLDPRTFEGHMKTIENTSIRIAKIVAGLRTFARDGASDRSELTSAHRILTETVALCQERFQSSGVKFEVVGGEDFSLDCKVIQVEQVLINLLNNAFDAVKESPHAWIRVSAGIEGDNACFRITDSGNGIPAEIVQKIMQPFFTTKPIGQGTGLGLSISHGIAKSHGGDLTVNRLSANTQFVLSIPLKQAKSIEKVG